MKHRSGNTASIVENGHNIREVKIRMIPGRFTTCGYTDSIKNRLEE